MNVFVDSLDFLGTGSLIALFWACLLYFTLNYFTLLIFNDSVNVNVNANLIVQAQSQSQAQSQPQPRVAGKVNVVYSWVSSYLQILGYVREPI